MSEWEGGRWVEISEDEFCCTVALEGGLEALTVFSSLTDPDGIYGPRQVYTAWGIKGSNVPLVDIRDYKFADGSTDRRVVRRFAALATVSSEEGS